MKITFIRPNLIATRAPDAMEPLAFACLAGLTPRGVELELYDERLEALPDELDTDLAAITVETFTARRAYQLAARLRKRGTPVVMGGYHPSFLPDEALQYGDSVVAGDAEGVWEQVVEDARRGTLRRIYRQTSSPSMEGLRFDRRLFQNKRYKKMALVQYGRGCRFACDFCSIHAFYGSETRQRPIADVVDEIARLPGRRVLFVDDNLFVDREHAAELFRALTPLNIEWGCQVTIDIARDPELLDLMAESGCFAVLIGFESLNHDSLREMRKGWNTKGCDYSTAIRRLRERGIMIYGSFLFGYDHDTVDAFEATARFAVESKFILANFSPLNPLPGSRLYDRLGAEGRLLFNRWWLDPAYRFGQATYRPKQMSPDELTDGCQRAREIFYGHAGILRRGFDRHANARNATRLAAFIGANLTGRNTLATRVGRPLGDADIPVTLPVELLDPVAAPLSRQPVHSAARERERTDIRP